MDDPDFRALIESSSFGTPDAVALRSTVSDERAAEIVARSQATEGARVTAILARARRGTPAAEAVAGKIEAGSTSGGTLAEPYPPIEPATGGLP